ncbi:MAG TPA: hypothetical protein VGQ19_15435, partial [Burkholderiales bacterium]|nr:hypothetical protein [Burkholderiales bacterium]
TLSPDAATVGASGKGDYFVEGLAAATHRLTGNTASGSYVDGSVLLRKYGDLDQFDLLGLRGGWNYGTDSGRLLAVIST